MCCLLDQLQTVLLMYLQARQGDKCVINVSFIDDALIQKDILLLMALHETWFSSCLIIHAPFLGFGPAATSSSDLVRFSTPVG